MTVSSTNASYYCYPGRSITLGDVKKRLICPISHKLLEDPVKAFPCGHHFELGRLDLKKSICPIDSKKVEKTEKDNDLIQLIEKFREFSRSHSNEACGHEVTELYLEIQKCQAPIDYERTLETSKERGARLFSWLLQK